MSSRTSSLTPSSPRKQPHSDWSKLLHPVHVREAVISWLKEDTPSLDYGGFVVGDKHESASLVCKGNGVLAGVPFFEAVFRELDCSVCWSEGTKEGDCVQPLTILATIEGKSRNILLGERVALNCLSRASGIATRARDLVDTARHAGWSGVVAGTRKTTPGFRLVEKYSLLVGGADTHRYDLSSMVMLKDNHIWSQGGDIIKTVQNARSVCGFSMKIEVECRSLAEAMDAANAGADVIMLDNFEPKALHETARKLKQNFSRILIESSGGLTPANLVNFLGEDIDVVSLGCLTQGVPVVDFSLKINAPGRDPTNPLVASGMTEPIIGLLKQ